MLTSSVPGPCPLCPRSLPFLPIIPTTRRHRAQPRPIPIPQDTVHQRRSGHLRPVHTINNLLTSTLIILTDTLLSYQVRQSQHPCRQRKRQLSMQHIRRSLFSWSNWRCTGLHSRCQIIPRKARCWPTISGAPWSVLKPVAKFFDTSNFFLVYLPSIVLVNKVFYSSVVSRCLVPCTIGI